ncbi:hypothetical protein [Nocardioides sp. CFH 31398]|uniref:hypothetical protein n=1 Tax=Nocardioides sp. CFH 31398 TaxID=2919579 RepID=UPI001F05317D|nr:hypothetical protein [Nocardioides sp. CFH 31398]MCH1867465.1 hypothetical protein [Nocardioides sp. CFH 31398]
MLTILLVYVAGFVLTCVAVAALARRYEPLGRGRVLIFAGLWPLVLAGLLLTGAVFAPIELAARRRRRRDEGSGR